MLLRFDALDSKKFETMNVLKRIWRSTLGKKYIMALSGLALVVFVIGHMVGNLQFFLGPEPLNRYAHFLQSNVELLWPVRIVLLSLAVLHVVTAISLWRENRAARPVDYEHGQPPYGADWASRMMLVGGLSVGCFLVYHLLHYTLKVEAINFSAGNFRTDVFKDSAGHPDVYAMMVAGFSQPLACLFYFAGVGFLCIHLSHGIAAMFQSLGFVNQVYRPIIEKGAKIIAVALCVGYLAIPSAVLLGCGREYLAKKQGQQATSIALKENRK